MSRRDLQLARGANHHVSHVMIDDRIFPRLRNDRVENDALAGRDRICGNSAERVFRVSIGVNRSEHSADDVEGAPKIWSGIDHIEPDALPDFGRERMMVVLEGDAVEDNFVGPDAHHLVVIARHERAFGLRSVPFALHQHVTHVGRWQRLGWIDDDGAVHSVGNVLQHWRRAAVVNKCARSGGDK